MSHVIGLNLKAKAIQHLEESSAEKSLDQGQVTYLRQDTESSNHTILINWTSSKLNPSAHKLFKKMKSQTTDLEKIFAIHICLTKKLYPDFIKNAYKSVVR